MRDAESYETFGELRELPSHLEIPAALWIGALCAALAGLATGLAEADRCPPERALRCAFFAAGFLYGFMSLIDFAEHFRIEKQLTGRYLGTRFVPLGESVNHLLTTACVVGIFALARPLTAPLETRDWVLLTLPALFLAFGVRDELVYHRRRSYHREDILHTVSHLSSGVMLACYLPSALVDWSRFG